MGNTNEARHFELRDAWNRVEKLILNVPEMKHMDAGIYTMKYEEAFGHEGLEDLLGLEAFYMYVHAEKDIRDHDAAAKHDDFKYSETCKDLLREHAMQTIMRHVMHDLSGVGTEGFSPRSKGYAKFLALKQIQMYIGEIEAPQKPSDRALNRAGKGFQRGESFEAWACHVWETDRCAVIERTENEAAAPGIGEWSQGRGGMIYREVAKREY